MPDNAATLDGVVESSEAVFEAKFMLPGPSHRSRSDARHERIELLGRVRRRLHPLGLSAPLAVMMERTELLERTTHIAMVSAEVALKRKSPQKRKISGKIVKRD